MNLFELYAKIGLDDSEYKRGIKDVKGTSADVKKAIDSLSGPFGKLEKAIDAVSNPSEKVSTAFESLKSKTEAIRHPIQTLNNRFIEAAKSLEEKREKMKTLVSSYDEAKSKVSELNSAYRKSVKETGEASEETKALADQLTEAKLKAVTAKSALERYAKSINEASASSKTFGERCKEAARGAEAIEKGFSTIGSIAVKGFAVATGAVTAITGALLGAESATEEYRIAQGKLNTAFETAGYTTDVAKGVYQEFFRIIGDTDTATEASQLLAKLALNQEDMSTWTRISAGVWGTFGDSLPIEGLIESANETARVGQVTGSLADALNWASISEDEFNKKLEKCSTEEERNQLIMETLAAEYDAAADAFYRNNDALIANRDAQTKVTDALAKIGTEVSRVKSDLLEKFAPAIEEVSGKIADFISKIDVDEVIESVTNAIKDAAAWLEKWGGLIVGVASGFATLYVSLKAMSIISSITTEISAAGGAMGVLSGIIAALGGPVTIVIAVITGLVAAIVYLWNTSEEFRTVVTNIWNSICDAFFAAVDWMYEGVMQIAEFFVVTIPNAVVSAWESFKSFCSQLGSLLLSAIDNYVYPFVMGIFEFFVVTIPNAVTSAWESFKSFCEQLATVPGLIGEFLLQVIQAVAEWAVNMAIRAMETGQTFVRELATGIASLLIEIYNKGVELILQIISGIVSMFSDLVSAGIETVMQIIDGIKAKFEDLVNTGSKIIGKIVSGLESVYHTIVSAGRSVIDKFREGIAAAWDSLASWFNDLWDNLFNKSVNVNVNKGPGSAIRAPMGSVLSPAGIIESVLEPGSVVWNRSGSKNSSGITIVQNIQTVPQTPVELAAATQSYFEQARWAF